jgi:hypothetical protein
MKSLHSLLITTSHENFGHAAGKTGVWLEDLTAAYFILKDGGEFITVASPAGGQIPIDPKSQSLIAWPIDDDDITVEVSGTTVTLTGTVDSWYQRDEAEKIAWNAPGVWAVANELVVDYDYALMD